MDSSDQLFGNEKNYVPIGIDGQVGELTPSSYFLAHSLLASRLELGLSTDGPPQEQDVNIYLVQLLGAYAKPKHFLEVTPYLADYDQDLFIRLQYSISNRFKYRVYRINADHLLMNVGIFHPDDRMQGARWWQHSQVKDLGRGQTYYDYAASFGSRAFGAHSGVPEVLGKLSVGFEKYVVILRHLRGEYLNMMEHLSNADLCDLAQKVQARRLEERHNDFLDALRVYQREVTPESRASLLSAVQNVQKVDPHFQYTLPADND